MVVIGVITDTIAIKEADIRSKSLSISKIKLNSMKNTKLSLGMRHDVYETDFNLVADDGALVGDKFKINDDMLSTRLGYIYTSDC